MATAAQARVLTFSPLDESLEDRADDVAEHVADFLAQQGEAMARAISQRYREIVKDDSPSSDEERLAEEIIDYVGFESWTALGDYIWEPMAEIAVDSSSELLDGLSINDSGIFNLVSQDAVRWAHERAAELIGKKWIDGQLIDNPDPAWAITETTRDLLRSAVADAIESAQGWQDLATEIRDSYAFSADRAALIGRFEIGNAHMMGAFLSAKASGLQMVKTWQLGTQHDIDDECDENAAVGDLPLDTPFPSGIVAGLAHPRCECRVSYTVVEK